jgi:hypothetical protein
MLSGKANDLLVGQAFRVTYADQREGTLEAKLSHNLAPIISLASVMPCPVIFAVADSTSPPRLQGTRQMKLLRRYKLRLYVLSFCREET